jgi:hypothetical protein
MGPLVDTSSPDRGSHRIDSCRCLVKELVADCWGSRYRIKEFFLLHICHPSLSWWVIFQIVFTLFDSGSSDPGTWTQRQLLIDRLYFALFVISKWCGHADSAVGKHPICTCPRICHGKTNIFHLYYPYHMMTMLLLALSEFIVTNNLFTLENWSGSLYTFRFWDYLENIIANQLCQIYNYEIRIRYGDLFPWTMQMHSVPALLLLCLEPLRRRFLLRRAILSRVS